MLLLSFLSNISECQTEDLVTFNLVATCFVGLAVDKPAPDHSTLSLFKARLLEDKTTTAFAMLLQEIIAMAQEQGLSFGSIQVLDSSMSLLTSMFPKWRCSVGCDAHKGGV